MRAVAEKRLNDGQSGGRQMDGNRKMKTTKENREWSF